MAYAETTEGMVAFVRGCGKRNLGTECEISSFCGLRGCSSVVAPPPPWRHFRLIGSIEPYNRQSTRPSAPLRTFADKIAAHLTLATRTAPRLLLPAIAPRLFSPTMPPTTRRRTTAAAVPPKSVDNVKSAAVTDAPAAKATPVNDRTSKKRPLSQAFPASKASTSISKAAPMAKSPKKKAVTAATPVEAAPPLPVLSEDEVRLCTTIPFPRLSFPLKEGTEHLVQADPRFRTLLRRIPLRVFEEFTDEHLETESAGDGEDKVQPRAKDLDLFKTLVTSILGQQVSWLAARAILYKFTRLWFPE